MEASDMCDVIHTLYEEDITPLFEEHQKVKSQLRTAIWKHIYNRDYKHGVSDRRASGGTGGSALPPEESLLPDDVSPKPLKPYIAPTDPSEFSSVLDAPLGGIPKE